MTGDVKSVLQGVVLKQGGKVVDGEPQSDNYAVYPVKGGPFEVISGAEVVKALKAAYPRCIFTWCAKAVETAAQPKGKGK